MTYTTVAVTVDTWSQTWDLGKDLDADDLALINSDGCVLDGLTASWAADDLFSQPDPVTVKVDVYFPAAAGAPAPTEGVPLSVLILPPGYTAGEYAPMLEFYGRVTDAAGVPALAGIRYTLTAVDHGADRGEARVGARKWPQETTADRVPRIAQALAGRGIDLEHQWTSDPGPSSLDDLPGWLAFQVDHLPVSWMDGSYYAPTWPARPAQGIPANDMLAQVTQARPGWFAASTTEVADHRHAGVFDLAEEYAAPRTTDWRRFWAHPYIAAGVTGSGDPVHRVLWATCRVVNDAGLPFHAEVVGGVLELTARAETGTIPDTSRDGAWIPACAVPKDSITWAVDKSDYPNRVTLSGFWVDWRDPQDGVWHWWEDRTWEQPERVRDRGPTEAQLDVSYLTPPDMSEDNAGTTPPLNEGDWIANTHLGFWSDSLPRFAIDSFDVLTRAIPNPDQWPRLFPDPHFDGVFGGHLGRFLFIYGMESDWNPNRQDHYFGQLTGATLTVQSGELNLTASITQRRPGPNGPVGTLPTLTDFTSGLATLDQLVHGEDPTPAIKWTDLAGSLSGLSWEQIDPSVTALDLWLTLLP